MAPACWTGNTVAKLNQPGRVAHAIAPTGLGLVHRGVGLAQDVVRAGVTAAQPEREGAVDLELVEREAPQVGQARIAGAEIVHGDAHTQFVQRAQVGFIQAKPLCCTKTHLACSQHTAVKVMPICMAKDGMRQRRPLLLGGRMVREMGLNQRARLPGEQHRAKVKNDIHSLDLFKMDW